MLQQVPVMEVLEELLDSPVRFNVPVLEVQVDINYIKHTTFYYFKLTHVDDVCVENVGKMRRIYA